MKTQVVKPSGLSLLVTIRPPSPSRACLPHPPPFHLCHASRTHRHIVVRSRVNINFRSSCKTEPTLKPFPIRDHPRSRQLTHPRPRGPGPLVCLPAVCIQVPAIFQLQLLMGFDSKHVIIALFSFLLLMFQRICNQTQYPTQSCTLCLYKQWLFSQALQVNASFPHNASVSQARPLGLVPG